MACLLSVCNCICVGVCLGVCVHDLAGILK